jgi:hypothetical protein
VFAAHVSQLVEGWVVQQWCGCVAYSGQPGNEDQYQVRRSQHPLGSVAAAAAAELFQGVSGKPWLLVPVGSIAPEDWCEVCLQGTFCHVQWQVSVMHFGDCR